MKKLILIATTLFAAQHASADGYVCKNFTGDLKIAVYNQVQPTRGTRNAAKMILSNPTYKEGNKTIATFAAETGLLKADSVANYVAQVDLRYSGSNRKGELIGGTKLGELDFIQLFIDHSYAAKPVAHGYEVAALAELTKRNGEVIPVALVCARYLKTK